MNAFYTSQRNGGIYRGTTLGRRTSELNFHNNGNHPSCIQIELAVPNYV